jgi:hypothetical protein
MENNTNRRSKEINPTLIRKYIFSKSFYHAFPRAISEDALEGLKRNVLSRLPRGSSSRVHPDTTVPEPTAL